MIDTEKVMVLRELLEACCNLLMRCKGFLTSSRHIMGGSARLDKIITEIECFEKVMNEKFTTEVIQ